jgi:hypothetical protein
MARYCLIFFLILLSCMPAFSQVRGGTGNPQGMRLELDGSPYECNTLVLTTNQLSIAKGSGGRCTLSTGNLVTLLGQSVGDVASEFANPWYATGRVGHLGAELQMDSGGFFSKGTDTGIRFNDTLELWNADTAITGVASVTGMLNYNGGTTISSAALGYLMQMKATGTLTDTVGGNGFGFIGTDVLNPLVYERTTGAGGTSSLFIGYFNPTIRANGVAANVNTFGFVYAPTYAISNAGSMSASSSKFLTYDLAIGASVTVPDSNAIRFNDATGSGTLTNQVPVDCAALTKGATLNTCMRSATTRASGRYHLQGTGNADISNAGGFMAGSGTTQAEGAGFYSATAVAAGICGANEYWWQGDTTPTPDVFTICDNGNLVRMPGASDTLVGKATTDALTNKTLDAEGTGNVITQPEKLYFRAGICGNSTVYPDWDHYATNPVATCVNGTVNKKLVFVFDDTNTCTSTTATTGCIFQTFQLPADFTGAVDAKLLFTSTSTTNAQTTIFTIATKCSTPTTGNNGAVDDPATFNAIQSPTYTNGASEVSASLRSVTQSSLTLTGCSAGDLMHIRVGRNISDTSTSTATNLVGMELTLRRAM